MITFGNVTIRNSVGWVQFKDLVRVKRLKAQYQTLKDGYEVFALDNDILYTTKLIIGDVPYTNDESQSTSDTYTQDFINNCLPTANKISVLRNELIDGYDTPLAVKDGDTMPGGQPGIMMHAKDGYEPAKVRALETISDGSVNRLAVQSRIAPGSSVILGSPIPENLNDYVVERLKRQDTLSDNMIVDGSVTPIDFLINAPTTEDGYDIAVGEVRLVISTQDFVFNGTSFGGKAALPNGLQLSIVSSGETIIVLNVNVNEDFLFFPSASGLTLNNTGPKDVMVASISLGGAPIIYRNSADYVRLRVRDNLTGGGAGEFNYFKAQLYGERVNQ